MAAKSSNVLSHRYYLVSAVSPEYRSDPRRGQHHYYYSGPSAAHEAALRLRARGTIT